MAFLGWLAAFASLMGSISPNTAALELTFNWLVTSSWEQRPVGDYQGFCHPRRMGIFSSWQSTA
jgi:hypothetical protein